MKNKTIYLAGGCFWGVEAYFSMLKGVTNAESGYANGNIKNPTYRQVVEGIATHAEVVKIEYNGNLEVILTHFLDIINPYTLNRQGPDIGIQYRSGIYYEDESDLEIITKIINDFEAKKGRKTVIEVLPLDNYYKAEEYHQKYLEKNKGGYCHIDLTKLKPEDRK